MTQQQKMIPLILAAFLLFLMFASTASATSYWQEKADMALDSYTMGLDYIWDMQTNASQTLIQGWDTLYNWELQQCEQKLSSEISSTRSLSSSSTIDPYIFATTLTLQAYQRSNPYEGTYFENEVSWYVHSIHGDINFSIVSVSDNGRIQEVVPIRTATTSTGDAGYESWIGNEKLVEMRIDYEEKQFTVPVVSLTE